MFIVEESFAGTLDAKGFEERLMRRAPPPPEPEEPGQFWKDFIRDTAPVFRGSTFDQLASFIAPTWQALVDGARYADERLAEIFGELEPEVIVEDNVVAFPAIPASGRPWVRIVSCNPLELKDPELPPPYSGLPLADSSEWEAFGEEYAAQVEPLQADFSAFCVERGAPPLPPHELIHESPWLDLTIYPTEVDYPRSRPLAPTWHNLETSVRATDEPWSPPESDGRPLVYLSLGSLGSADLPLMERLVDALSETPHRYVVSKGPQHAEYELADNMVGAEFLPQASLLPHVDLVITHGGNNTTTECMWFGKPTVVLPIFWDQHDNAQRVHETGFGMRRPRHLCAWRPRAARSTERSPMARLRDEHGQVTVETPAATVRAETAVLATSSAIGTKFKPLRSLVSVASSHIVLTEPVPDVIAEVGWTGHEGVVDFRTLLHYFRTTEDGRIAFGWGGGRMGTHWWYRGVTEVDPRASATAARALVRVFPQLRGRKLTHAWGGPIDVSSTRLPQFRKFDNVLTGAGFTGNGIAPSYLGGQILARMALDQRDELTRLLLVEQELKRFPPEPLRLAAGSAIRAAMVRRDRAQDAGTDAGPAVRFLTSLPRRLGMHLPR